MEPNRELASLGAPASSPALPQTAETSPSRPQKGWYSRSYLPHLDAPGLVQAVTFRLADSLPREVFDRLDAELRDLPEKTQHTEKEKRVAAWLDRGEGSCHLADPAIAAIVEDSLLRNDVSRYRLLAWCVMPNHVHVLVEMANGWQPPDVVQAWKSFTAHEANVRLGREGAFWQREYHYRFIRDEKHLAAAKRYIEENPVAARLVAKKADWRSSSAWSGWVVGKNAGEDAGAPCASKRT